MCIIVCAYAPRMCVCVCVCARVRVCASWVLGGMEACA